jgi:hypothetical protein
MRRVWIALTVISVALVMALPVGAEVDCLNPKFAANPTCEDPVDPPPIDDRPGAGHTCTDDGKSVAGDFRITLSGRSDGACIDVSAKSGPWTVDVEIVSGSVRMLLFVPRDSIGPGDSCGGYEFRSNNVPSQFVVPFEGGSIPGSYVNSCGTEFAEWVNVLNSDSGLYELTYFDAVDEDIESPLALQIMTAGSKDSSMTLTVDLPGVDNQPIDVTPTGTTP